MSSGQWDGVMGNVTPLLKKIYSLEAYIQILEETYLDKPLDKSEKYVLDKVEGDHTDEPDYINRYLGRGNDV